MNLSYHESDKSAAGFIEHVDLERIQIVVQHKINKYNLLGIHGIEVARWLDDMTDSVCLNFRAYVLGESQKPIEVCFEPSSVWQMFKRDFMPKWFVSRFPVRGRRVIVDAKCLYPDLKVSVPLDKSRVAVVFNVRNLP